MPHVCGIINCGNRSERDRKSFYRLPSILSKGGDKKMKLSAQRRRKWLNAIRRNGLTELTKSWLRVCEDHFITGRPSALEDIHNPDWAPSINLGYERVESTKFNLAAWKSDVPQCCCVPNCPSNDATKKNVVGFPFPEDEKLNKLWQEKIVPRNFKIRPNSIVCAKHFLETDIIYNEAKTLPDGTVAVRKMKHPKLREGAYPCIFADHPTFSATLQKLLSIEKKLKIRSLMRIGSDKYGAFTITELYFSQPFYDSFPIEDKFLSILDCELDFGSVSEHDLRALLYIGGYCVYKLNIECPNCLEYCLTEKSIALTSEFHEYNEAARIFGTKSKGLKVPTNVVITTLSVSYKLFLLLVSQKYESDFENCKNQVVLQVGLTILLIKNLEIVDLKETCSLCQEPRRNYIIKIVQIFSNICLNNYVKQYLSVKTTSSDIYAQLAGLCGRFQVKES